MRTEDAAATLTLEQEIQAILDEFGVADEALAARHAEVVAAPAVVRSPR